MQQKIVYVECALMQTWAIHYKMPVEIKESQERYMPRVCHWIAKVFVESFARKEEEYSEELFKRATSVFVNSLCSMQESFTCKANANKGALETIAMRSIELSQFFCD